MHYNYYKIEHHDLDVHPRPREDAPLFINEPWLADATYREYSNSKEPENEPDNRRVYIPLDLNKNAILRRLDEVIRRYGEVSEKNELNFSIDVAQLLYQVEIYDQLWYVRHMPKNGKHSLEAVELIKEFIARLEAIPDACAEVFPFELIDDLKKEFL